MAENVDGVVEECCRRRLHDSLGQRERRRGGCSRWSATKLGKDWGTQ